MFFAGRLPLQAQSQKLYAPILAETTNGGLGVTLVNPTLSEVRVTLTARTYAGAAIQQSGVSNPVTLTLPATTQKAMMATEIFGQGISGQSGWIEMSSSAAAIKGFYLV